MPETGTVDTVKEDIGTSPADKVKRWKAEIKLAEKAVEGWHKSADEVVRRYRDEEDNKYNRFNILWANTETLKPVLFGQVPVPDVRRRITDPANPDPVGRNAATVLERGLAFSVDDYDFAGLMGKAVEDYLLPGRAVARIRYIPTMAMGEAPRIPVESVEDEFNEFGVFLNRRFMAQGREVPAEKITGSENLALGDDLDALPEDARPFLLGVPEEEVVNEEARCEYVFWKDYLESPARTWEEVRWVAFRSRLTRKELRQQFPGVANDVTLDWSPKGVDSKDDVAEFFKKATVWEIWDKETKTVIPIAVGYDVAPLAEWDDPMELDGFYPNPRPLDFVTTNGSRIPIPVYKVYQNQAEELNTITQRINKLIGMLKVRGLYDGVTDAIGRILKQEDGALIGVDNFAELMEKGGLDRVITFLPLDQIAKVLTGLYVQREQVKRTIYEITGLSDLIRGLTDPRETKGAQVLKAEFSSLRLQSPQGQVQRFIRDLYRLKAEVMAEHFSEDTLRQISGLELPGEEQLVQAAESLKANPTDEAATEILNKPTWDQVRALLKDDGARAFRIDVETDTTIQPDAGKAKKEAVEMMQAVANFMKEALPVIQAAPDMAPLMGQLLRLLLRQFKPGRLVEEALDQALQELEKSAKQPQQDPEVQAQQAEQAKEQREQEAEQAKLQRDEQEMAAKAEVEKAKQNFEREKHDDEMAFKREELKLERDIARGNLDEKVMAQFGPGIIEALVAVTETLTAAVQTIGGEKEIIFEGSGRNRRPVGIRPVTSAGQTIQ